LNFEISFFKFFKHSLKTNLNLSIILSIFENTQGPSGHSPAEEYFEKVPQLGGQRKRNERRHKCSALLDLLRHVLTEFGSTIPAEALKKIFTGVCIINFQDLIFKFISKKFNILLKYSPRELFKSIALHHSNKSGQAP
jgi:hypothetical protein